MSYGPDKSLTFNCDLDLGPTCMSVSNGTSTCDGEQLSQIILKSICNCRSYGPDKFGQTDTSTDTCTDTHMHIHRPVVVSKTISHSSQAGATKMINPSPHCANFEQP